MVPPRLPPKTLVRITYNRQHHKPPKIMLFILFLFRYLWLVRFLAACPVILVATHLVHLTIIQLPWCIRCQVYQLLLLRNKLLKTDFLVWALGWAHFPLFLHFTVIISCGSHIICMIWYVWFLDYKTSFKFHRVLYWPSYPCQCLLMWNSKIDPP